MQSYNERIFWEEYVKSDVQKLFFYSLFLSFLEGLLKKRSPVNLSYFHDLWHVNLIHNYLLFQITESLKRLRAKKASRINEDIDFENSVANLENRIKISDKILESVGLGSTEISGARRALKENEERTEKRISRRLNEENGLTKWTALKDFDDESAAVQRAKATRARLTNLEDEMSELNERTAAREKRAARLRALVADSEADSTLTTTNVASSKISVRAEREKKQVTF